MKNRVVITGIGVVAPNGVGVADFTKAIKAGTSGITFHQSLKDKGFSCCIGGIPTVSEEKKATYLSPLQLRGFNSTSILYGCMAGIDAWKDAGFKVDENSDLEHDSGLIFGTGTSGIEKFREAIYKIDDQKVRRLGSTSVVQTMASGISAYLGGLLGLGNQVTTNSSACTTGTEALLMGFERIKNGKAKRMLVGSSSDSSLYTWGGFDAMRVMSYKHNDSPEKGSRPMSETAAGFVPGSGAGALVLESLESALERKATIYAEVLGGDINSGGQRNGGTLTAPNSEAVQRCITNALVDAQISSNEIDLINGHLTATSKDALEIENWTKALQRKGTQFPYINSLKSMVGHCLAAAGAIESVASVIQLKEQFMFPNINCEDIHPEISALIAREKVPQKTIEKKINIIAKASFGFGDVNACVIFKKYSK
ncbi:MAG: beta-ketoacyl-[acyl-carrier-protein] synthase family protein [Polaribacter sp.]|jgi:3-oxoacyl-[acyl-carrier-protein] synthase-1|nr:beta-ketoacyl-[acyl-carrier-protein] synthase family protein [Polaribacter sp.]MBT5099853.1 beta-ketoacyl-[acyl-carrier-protein] synthase family protein [Polaribacter sp.]MBT5646154.1 beta-ketoacyl-[acyl-carrier-protein] synthase family protein [Polaribacter sp.]MBT7705504.1 beta-ketoacyl-[acyl-carrier-protein] synthase family protein [Polaribacter sp.]MDB4010665.1 beta-ketoacyl-[acyl-carrier-protein] synthase family protein [Polaribacter sp.]